MMRIYQVDAFTKKVFGGNPAGVCILSEDRNEGWMQNVAMEMNLSETAFLVKEGEGYHLRWFTPESEVDLCGHATLASAHILWETGEIKPDAEAVFYTKSGILRANKSSDFIELNFPKEEEKTADCPQEILKGLGIKPTYMGKNRMDYLVEVESEEIVRNIHPDFELLKRLDIRGFIVTSKAEGKDYDFVSRFFAPAYGIYEDPATGSAQCCLGPYWQKKLQQDEMISFQASKRGASFRLRMKGDRVKIGGYAITVFLADMDV